jgi:RNA polymerase sigma-70 factor, ECF subfamily
VTSDQTPQHRRFDELFREHRTAVLGFLVRRVHQPADAADLLADVFVVAWRRLDTVPDGERARLWLYGVAHNVLSNHRRGMRRREALAGELAAYLGRPGVVPTDESMPDAVEVRAAIAALPSDDQTIVTLNAWEGLSSAEIARVVGMNPSTVRVRLHRARARLRERLGLPSHEDDLPSATAR